MNNVPYASVVGNLMYIMLSKQLGICFAVGLVGRYQSNSEPPIGKLSRESFVTCVVQVTWSFATKMGILS